MNSSIESRNEATSSPSLSRSLQNTRVRRTRKWKTFTLLFSLFALCLAGFAGWFYGTPSGDRLRIVLAEDVLSSQHPSLANFLVGKATRDRIKQQLFHPLSENTVVSSGPVVSSAGQIDHESQLIQSVTIHERTFTAYVLKINDPSAVHLAETRYRSKGEALSEIMTDTGALAGINAGGFDDPKGNGSGGTPIGTVFSLGQVVHTIGPTAREMICALLEDNSFIVGTYSAGELESMHARDAVHFYPELIANGHPMITSGDGGWGYAPRTAIGATANGQIIMIVTNGRFIDGPWNLGASLKDVQDLLLAYGAVNALNLDGGGSATMMLDGKLMNHPETSTAAGMRYLPNAFIVVPKPGLVQDGPGQLPDVTKGGEQG